MMKEFMTQSQKRFQESLDLLFNKALNPQNSCLFLKSSSDEGVIRNGGRNGARFAPQSFLSTFKKFTLTEKIKSYIFKEMEVSNQEEERVDFHRSQELESKRIQSILDSYDFSRIYHIGGGHDHIYPLLKALGHATKKLIIINIDAHADTRTDTEFNSGTPFRQMANEFSGEFHLFQIGLHPFSNSFSTLSPLGKNHVKILWRSDLTDSSLKSFFEEIQSLVEPDCKVVFSIDADALSAAEIPGVSAVNPAGLTREELLKIWKLYKNLPLAHGPITGIYELNPLYDHLSSLSMRTMGSFVFDTL
jgi:formiminoglutamase